MIPPSELISFGTAVLTSLGVPQPDARLVADSLVTADAQGHPSHGVLRLEWYADRLRSGAMRAVTDPATVLDGGAVAVPGGRRGPVVLDIANTTVARGKIYAALERGEPLPTGWAHAADGTPTTDPRQALDGLILPMAGHKGYGIAFMMEILSGVLTGGSYATDVVGPYVPDRRSGCGHLLLALRLDAVADPADYARRLDDLIDRTKAVPLAPGFDEILHPGEIEDRNAAEAARTGLRLPGRTLRGLERLARACAIPPPRWMTASSP